MWPSDESQPGSEEEMADLAGACAEDEGEQSGTAGSPCSAALPVEKSARPTM